MNQKKILLLSLLIVSSVQKLKSMHHPTSQFIIECVPAKNGLRAYSQEHIPSAEFHLRGIQANNALVDTKILFTLPAFTKKFELSMETNTADTFHAEHENKKYITKLIPFMAQENRTLLLVKIKSLE